MTLDEAIRHAEEVAEEQDKRVPYKIYDDDEWTEEQENCHKCAVEHRQLAEWLRDYKRLKKQEPCEDAISRQAVFDKMKERDEELSSICPKDIRDLPPVKPQEPSITWVTGADGAKIAFWDVPVWKVTKICEILGESQKGANE